MNDTANATAAAVVRPLPHQVCLTAMQMRLSGSGIEKVIYGYIMPFIILFGVTGNLINLTVLLTPSMKSRSNKLLAALAMADVLCLVFLIPHCLANYETLASDPTFRKIYYSLKMSTIGFANWSSAIAIWLILTICLERLIGIRYPLSARKRRICNTGCIIMGIVVVTGLLTVFHHFGYDCKTKTFCNGTQLYMSCLAVDSPRWLSGQPNPHPLWLQNYVHYSGLINVAVVVFLPTVVVVITNALLIKTLNERKQFLRVSTSIKNDNSQSTNQLNSQMRTEQRITFTVCSIVTCFIVTQAPSAVYQLLVGQIKLSVMTMMVAVGKSLNFALFCLSSSSFRQRLIALTKDRFNRSLNNKRKEVERRCSADTTLTITCSCAQEHNGLLRNAATSASGRCSRAMSLRESASGSRVHSAHSGRSLRVSGAASPQVVGTDL